MAPNESSRSSSSKSKKPTKNESDEEDDRHSLHKRRSSHSTTSSKKTDQAQAPKTSLLKNMFTRDRTGPPSSSRLDSAMFRDDEKKASSSSTAKSSKPKQKEAKEKEKVRKEVDDTDTYADEPDFSQFKSTFSEPVKEKKPEKKPEKKVEKKVERKPEKKPEKKESQRRDRSPVRRAKIPKSLAYESRPSKSAATPKFKTAFRSAHDISMAEKQTKIAELEGEELVKQEKWAQEKLKAHAGTCPMGFNWARFKQIAVPGQIEMEGYRCLGSNHFVTHELLAEGKGEIFHSTPQYANHLELIMVQQIPLQTPFFGQRWQGPVPVPAAEAAPPENPQSMEEYALEIMPEIFGTNIHPSMVPMLQQQLVQQMKQEELDEKAEEAAHNKFVNSPGSKGGPWWEDCA
ncbi:hypothetical protein BKA65DRAFT_533520 [Rhexocercosporidium sp. MPI-PUGE-AT-0058]|nr:hypothetical protein BKA65DRAFT_533520 [Rhexocercosporidium sp. MPI-PUGE-AT-0058]